MGSTTAAAAQPAPGWGPPPQSGGPPPPPRPKHTGRNILLGLIGAFLVLAVIGAMVGALPPSRRPPKAAAARSRTSRCRDSGPVTLGRWRRGHHPDIFGSETATLPSANPSSAWAASSYAHPEVSTPCSPSLVARKDNISSPEFYVLVNGEKFDREHFFSSNDRNLQFTSLQRGSRRQEWLLRSTGPNGQLIVPGGDGKPQAPGRSTRTGAVRTEALGHHRDCCDRASFHRARVLEPTRYGNLALAATLACHLRTYGPITLTRLTSSRVGVRWVPWLTVVSRPHDGPATCSALAELSREAPSSIVGVMARLPASGGEIIGA